MVPRFSPGILLERLFREKATRSSFSAILRPIITDGVAERGEEKGGKVEEREGERERKRGDRDRSCARVDTLARFITIRSDEAWPGKAKRAGA